MIVVVMIATVCSNLYSSLIRSPSLIEINKSSLNFWTALSTGIFAVSEFIGTANSKKMFNADMYAGLKKVIICKTCYFIWLETSESWHLKCKNRYSKIGMLPVSGGSGPDPTRTLPWDFKVVRLF
jgi:hypothetical protein